MQQLPTPSTAKDALKILGDQEDHAWPGSSWRFGRRILGCFKDSFGSRKQSRNYLNVLRFIQESLAISKQKATYDYVQCIRRVLNQQSAYVYVYIYIYIHMYGYIVNVHVQSTTQVVLFYQQQETLYTFAFRHHLSPSVFVPPFTIKFILASLYNNCTCNIVFCVLSRISPHPPQHIPLNTISPFSPSKSKVPFILSTIHDILFVLLTGH